MTDREFFTWLRQQFGKLTQKQVDAANILLKTVPAEELQKSLAIINGWPYGQGGDMQISQAGLDLIKEREGLRLEAYRDTGGVLTIGYGHTSAAGGLEVYPGLSITFKQAEDLLREDIARMVYPSIKQLVKVPLTQGQFDAMCSFIYNLGAGQVRTSTLLRKLNVGDYKGAAGQFERWVYDNGQKLEGLVIRREKEKDLFLS